MVARRRTGKAAPANRTPGAKGNGTSSPGLLPRSRLVMRRADPKDHRGEATDGRARLTRDDPRSQIDLVSRGAPFPAPETVVVAGVEPLHDIPFKLRSWNA